MQKRGWTRLPMLGLAVLLALPFVAAQAGPLSSVGNMIQRFLGPLLLQWDLGFGFWSKALLWILIFTLLYAVIGMVSPMREWSRNIRLTLALVLALISVLPLRGPLIRALFETYGVLVATVLIFVPIVGLIYVSSRLTRGLQDTSPRLGHGISAVLYYILAAVIQNVVTGVQQQAFSTSAALGEVGNFAVGVCGLLFLYHVIMMLFGGPEDTPRRQVGEAAGGLWDWMRDTVRSEHPPEQPPGTPYPDELVAHIEHLCASMTQFHNLIMHRDGYRYVGNLLLEAEYRAYRHRDRAMFAQIPQRRQNFRDQAAQARGLRDAVQASIPRLINDARFPTMRRAHHRQFQRCMRRWTVAYLAYQEYNIRFIVNYTRVAGQVRYRP